MRKSVLKSKSYAFALRVVKAYKFLTQEKEEREYVLSKQLLRSGTAVGALMCEAEYGESVADFIHKLHIALKEANETLYWLDLLRDGGFIDENVHNSIINDCTELIKILTSSINTCKRKQIGNN
jgi:four helix bundle protein